MNNLIKCISLHNDIFDIFILKIEIVCGFFFIAPIFILRK